MVKHEMFILCDGKPMAVQAAQESGTHLFRALGNDWILGRNIFNSEEDAVNHMEARSRRKLWVVYNGETREVLALDTTGLGDAFWVPEFSAWRHLGKTIWENEEDAIANALSSLCNRGSEIIYRVAELQRRDTRHVRGKLRCRVCVAPLPHLEAHRLGDCTTHLSARVMGLRRNLGGVRDTLRALAPLDSKVREALDMCEKALQEDWGSHEDLKEQPAGSIEK